MPIIEDSIVVNRKPEEVWDFLIEPDNVMLVDSSQIEVQQDGQMKQGGRRSGITKVAGRKINWTAETTVFEPPHKMRLESIEAPLSFAFDFLYEPVDDGTKCTIRCESEEGSGVFGRVGDAVATRMYAKQIRAILESTKEILEAE